MLHQILKQGELSSCVIITFQVMAFSGMSPGDPNAVRTLTDCGEKKLGAHPTGAWDSNDTNIGGIFHSADPRQIGCSVTAPVAQKRNDFGFPFRHWYLLVRFEDVLIGDYGLVSPLC
jgi:hypothetical protein